MTRSRPEKVRFLRSTLYHGRRLLLPLTMKFYNIIDPSSLPICTRRATERPSPDPEVYQFPRSYWPPSGTSMVSEDMGAEQLWETCRKNARYINWNNRYEKKMCHNNLCNSAKPSPSNPSIINRFHNQNEEMDTLLIKLEKLPEDLIQHELINVQNRFSPQDFIFLQHESRLRSKSYLQKLKESFEERSVGSVPDSNNPCNLSLELKRRVMSGSSQSLEEIRKKDHIYRRKQKFTSTLQDRPESDVEVSVV